MGLHGSHFRQTSISQGDTQEDYNVAPKQVSCTTVDADEKDVSDPQIRHSARLKPMIA